MELELLIAAVSSLMVMIPLWRITRRTGRDPWLSLLFLGTPPIGTLVFIALLAFGRWPAERAPGDADEAVAEDAVAEGAPGVPDVAVVADASDASDAAAGR